METNGERNHLREALLGMRVEREGFWYWLQEEGGASVSKRGANKFLMACIIDYHQNAERAWDTVGYLVEGRLGDPDDLWGWVLAHGVQGWAEKKSEYGLHRYDAAHARVFRIGGVVAREYAGDARNIWQGADAATTLCRLKQMRFGRQLSRMAVGALVDTGAIAGAGDVKGDTHLRTVLGRLVEGRRVSAERAVELARAVLPENPWLLDRPCYDLGRSHCFKSGPLCGSCPVFAFCAAVGA